MVAPRFSPACERNREPIREHLEFLFRDQSSVLEIGSGTGQHAAYFAASMPWLEWQSTELEENLPSLQARLEISPARLPRAMLLDVNGAWLDGRFGAVFSANTAHIMPWFAVEKMFSGVARCLDDHGRFVLYGPFHHGGRASSAGNRAFDAQLQMRGHGEGIRDIEAVAALAAENGLRLVMDAVMPANNRLLAWEKSS